MTDKKKKPRQRNRVRNKANRDFNPNESEEGVELHEAVEEHELEAPVSPQGMLEASTSTAAVTAVEPLKKAANLMVPLIAPTAPQNVNEGNESIVLIQKLLRAKLLKQNEDDKSKPDSVSNVKQTALPKSENNNVSNASTVKKSKSKEKLVGAGDVISSEKNAFIADLQRKMENAMANGNDELPNTLLDNLKKLLNQEPVSDVESSDDEGEYIEYVYKPRQYFLVSLCNLCKCDLRDKKLVQCNRCKMTYYCSEQHMRSDTDHKQLCHALRQVAEDCDGHIFYKCAEFSTEQFRSYRIVTIRKVEFIMKRPLTATEQEVILFPRICNNPKCREYRFTKLNDCKKCGQVAYCKDNPEHLNKTHHRWCRPYQLFQELILFQEKYGRLEPSLPTKILRDLPGACSNTKQILSKLGFDMKDACEYAALSQVSTCPLTAWYGLKLCDQLKKSEIMTIHLIGAEIEFEVDVPHKWELFFLHITPTVKELNVVFIGPELNPRNISFDQFKKTKCCRACQKNGRTINYHFENQVYHAYRELKTFLKPDLICFFNAGLYRCNGFQMEDTWPDTILAAANIKCPVVVTAYTEYETPQDMARFVHECNRSLNVVLPPTVNPFASDKPERNFISDEEAPLMFKNYYCFVVE